MLRAGRVSGQGGDAAVQEKQVRTRVDGWVDGFMG